MEEIRTKVCTSCKKELPITRFSKKSKAKDGLQYVCKECQSIQNKELWKKKKGVRKEDVVNKIVAESNDGCVIGLNKMFSNSELSKFTPRELMRELAARGYIGKLEYIERRVIDITKM